MKKKFKKSMGLLLAVVMLISILPMPGAAVYEIVAVRGSEEAEVDKIAPVEADAPPVIEDDAFITGTGTATWDETPAPFFAGFLPMIEIIGAGNQTIGNEQFTAVIGDLGQIRELRMKNNRTTYREIGGTAAGSTQPAATLDPDPNFLIGNTSARESSTAHQWTGGLIFATRSAATEAELLASTAPFREQDTNKTLANGGSTTTANISATNPRISRAGEDLGLTGRGNIEVTFKGLDVAPDAGTPGTGSPGPTGSAGNDARIMRGYDVISTYDMDTEDGSLLWTIEIQNKSDQWIEFGDIGMPMSWNTQYNGNSQTVNYSQRVVANAFAGVDSGYAHIKRASGEGNSLIFAPVPESGARIEYVDQWFRNFQGIRGERHDEMFYAWAHDSASWSTGMAVYYIHSKNIRSTGAGYHMDNTSLILGPGQSESYQFKFMPVRATEGNVPDEPTTEPNLAHPINDIQKRALTAEANLRSNLYNAGMVDVVALPGFQTAINMPTKMNLHFDKEIIRNAVPRILCVHQEECLFDCTRITGHVCIPTDNSGASSASIIVSNVAACLPAMAGSRHIHGRDCNFNDPYAGTHIPVLINTTGSVANGNYRPTAFRERGYMGVHKYFDGLNGRPLHNVSVAVNKDNAGADANGFFKNDRGEWNQVWDLSFGCIGNNSVRVDYELLVGVDEEGNDIWEKKFTQVEFNVLHELREKSIAHSDWQHRNQLKDGPNEGRYEDNDIHIGVRLDSNWGNDWSHPHFPAQSESNLLIPNIEEIKGLERYADAAAPRSMGGRGWLVLEPSGVNRTMGVNDRWGSNPGRTYSEFICATGFFGIYKIQKAYPDLMDYYRDRNWYLEIARGVMVRHGNSNWGKYGEQEVIDVYEALIEEGFAQADIDHFYNHMIGGRGRYMADARYPFISEFPFDNTGQESAYFFAHWYYRYQPDGYGDNEVGPTASGGGFGGRRAPAYRFVDYAMRKANLGDTNTRTMRSLAPTWFNYGNVTFLGGEAWWNFQYTTGLSGAIMDDYLRYASDIHEYTQAERAWANRVNYAGKISHFNVINMGQIIGPRPGSATTDVDNFGAMAFRYQMAKGGRGDQNSSGITGRPGNGFAANVNFNGFYAYGGEANEGIYGSMLRISTDVVTDPLFGLFAYGGVVSKAGNVLTVQPRDGFGKTLNFIDEGVYLNFPEDMYKEVRFTTDASRLEIDIEHLIPNSRMSRIIFTADGNFGGLRDGFYSITVPGTVQPVGQFKVVNGAGVANILLPEKAVGAVTTATLAYIGTVATPAATLIEIDVRNADADKLEASIPFRLEAAAYSDVSRPAYSHNKATGVKFFSWEVTDAPEGGDILLLAGGPLASTRQLVDVVATRGGKYTVTVTVTQDGIVSKQDLVLEVGALDDSAGPVVVTTIEEGPKYVHGQYALTTTASTAAIPGTLTYVWSQVGGAGEAVFSDPAIASPTVSFSSVGVYTIRLIVSDAYGRTVTTTHEFVVLPAPAPVISSLQLGNAEGWVSFNSGVFPLIEAAASMPGTALEYSWSVLPEVEGNSITNANAMRPTFRFGNYGSYQVTVVVTDILGQKATKSIVVSVTNMGSIPTVPNSNSGAVVNAAGGNIARLPSVTRFANENVNAFYNPAGTTLATMNITRTGVTANATNSSGSGATWVPRVNDGTKNQAAGSAYNNWGTAPGIDSNPVYIVMNWGEDMFIGSSRVEFSSDGNGQTSGTQIARNARIEWWDGAVWRTVTNMQRANTILAAQPLGFPVTNIVNTTVTDSSTLAIALIDRPNWNAVTFDPVTTSMIRLRVVQHQTTANTNGVGVSEWEVFGLPAGEAAIAPESDKSALLDAILAYLALDVEEFTEASWDKAVEAYEAALEIFVVETTLEDQEDIDAAAKALFDAIGALVCNYESVVTDPTCLKDGFTTHTCPRCKGSFVDSIVPALGHTPRTVTDTQPTATENGLLLIVCDICGVEITRLVRPATGQPGENITVSNARFLGVSNSNRITTVTFTATVVLPGGSSQVRIYSFDVPANNNNIDGRYVFPAGHELAGAVLTYDIKGNGSNIKAFSIGGAVISPGQPGAVGSVSNVRFLGVSNISRVTTVTFSATVVLPGGSSAVRTYSFDVPANNNNIDGRYVFPAGHDLAGSTLTYDIKGNGSNIKAFSIR